MIAWTGKSLPYNSALPHSLAVYSQIPYSSPPMEVNELDTCVEQLRARLAPSQRSTTKSSHSLEQPSRTVVYSSRALCSPLEGLAYKN